MAKPNPTHPTIPYAGDITYITFPSTLQMEIWRATPKCTPNAPPFNSPQFPTFPRRAPHARSRRQRAQSTPFFQPPPPTRRKPRPRLHQAPAHRPGAPHARPPHAPHEQARRRRACSIKISHTSFHEKKSHPHRPTSSPMTERHQYSC